MGRNKVRGIAKASQLNKKRSKDAKRTDRSKRAKKKVRPTKAGLKKWNENPGHFDIYPVDTPRLCKGGCGRAINSKYKDYCYKCYHLRKGDYNPKKLQKIFGGTK